MGHVSSVNHSVGESVTSVTQSTGGVYMCIMYMRFDRNEGNTSWCFLLGCGRSGTFEDPVSHLMMHHEGVPKITHKALAVVEEHVRHDPAKDPLDFYKDF